MRKMTKKIGYLGIPGSYSYLAARWHFKKNKLLSFANPSRLLEAIVSGKIARAVLPIRNSLSGNIPLHWQLLLSKAVEIDQVVHLPVEHYLLSKQPIKLEDIKSIYSHPEVFKQVERSLKGLPAKLVATTDTASAARYVADRGRDDEAAIGSNEAARLYGLQAQRLSPKNSKTNRTSFAIIGKSSTNKSFLTFLPSFREEIDGIDAKLVHLLNQRFVLTKLVGLMKKKEKMPVGDDNREKQIINHVQSLANKELQEPIVHIFKTIFAESKKRQSEIL